MMSFALTCNIALSDSLIEAVRNSALLTIQNHSLHFDHHHISEKTCSSHNTMINIDCHDDKSHDLKIENITFCDHNKHDEKSKIV